MNKEDISKKNEIAEELVNRIKQNFSEEFHLQALHNIAFRAFVSLGQENPTKEKE